MRINRLILLIIFLSFSSCYHPAPPVEPKTITYEELMEEAPSPERGASMRYVQKGRGELDQQRFERAVTQLTRAIEIDSSNPFAYFYLGLTRFQSGNFEQAKDLFRRAGDLFGDMKNWRSESYAYSGESYERISKLDMAKKMYLKAQELDSGNSRAQIGLERIGSLNG